MVTISFGQALLLLMNKYKEETSTCNALKEFYIQGVVSTTELDYIKELFSESGIIEEYEISYSAKEIDEDASRRYFETHLAFETLLNSLDKISIGDLSNYYNELYKTLPKETQNKYDNYLAGKTSPKEDNFATEYTDAFQKVQHHKNYQKLDSEQKEKVILILKASWFSVLHAKNPQIPLNLYGTGFFSEANRGRIVKEKPGLPTEKSPYYSNHFGLMKNYMPVPRNDIAYAESGFTFLKPSDQNTFNPESEWAKKNFSKLVHPFSCSISGTTLCQLRVMKKLKNEDQMPFDSQEKFATFLKCFMSSLLFNSGGHCFNEFLSVLEIPEIKKEFNFIDGFEQINATNLLLHGNEEAFEKALKDTLNYTQVLLAKKEMHDELRTQFGC